MVRLLHVAGIAVLSLALVVPASRAQSPAPVKKTLDERSVLLEWSGGGQTQAAPASVSAGEKEAAPAEVDEELEARVDEAMAAMNRGQIDEAMVQFRDILKDHPHHRRARFGAGTVLIQQTRYREALDLLEPLADEFSDDFFVKNNIAWIYATAKDPAVRDGAKAVRYAQDALLIAPHSYQVWNTLSEAYYILGEYEKSLRAAEEAVRVATSANAAPGSVADYKSQAEKARRAARAMSLVE